jgi:DNA-binding SARP family transcriptional activator
VEFRLLGRLEALAGGRPVDIGPFKQRLVLALLALMVNQPVHVDRLVDVTWPVAPPRTALHAIHVRVSRLRAALAGQGDDAEITTRGPTYSLHADPRSIDVHRFRHLVSNAHATTDDVERSLLLRGAMGLWRGPPLVDLKVPSIEELCRGLEELRLTAWEDLLDTELRLGRHGAVLNELVEFVAQYPYRQRFTALLMLALYRDGRAPEALHTYRQARSWLADEYGLDPHTQLQQMENAILRADPSLDLRQPRIAPDVGLLRAAHGGLSPPA